MVQDFSRDMLKPRNRLCEFQGVLQNSGSLKGWHWIQELKVLDENPANIKGLPILHSGFVDAHIHLSWMGEQLVSLQAPSFSTAEFLRDEFSKRFQNGTKEIEIAYNFQESLWLNGAQTPQNILAGLPKIQPWILFRLCGHRALVSEEVLRRSGLNPQAKSCEWVDGGKIFELYGWLEVQRAPKIADFVLRAQESLLLSGYSGVSDMAWDSGKVAAILNLHQDGKLLIDVAGVLLAGRAPEIEAKGPFWNEAGIKNSVTSLKTVVTCRHWKKFLDGSFGARTAWLSQPYSDAPDEYGRDLCEIRELIGEAESAMAAGFHLSFHAIGDSAIDRIIEVEEMLQNIVSSRRRMSVQQGLPATWHRIEHGQLIRPEQLEILAESKNWMICSQPYHRVMDQSFIKDRLGPDRMNDVYRFGSLNRGGLPAVLSSDGPIGSCRPEEVLKSVLNDERESERLSADQLLWLFTRGSRALIGLPDRSPLPGTFAWITEQA